MTQDTENSGRRGFLKSAVRTLCLAVITLLSGVLGIRKMRAVEDESLCVLVLPCQSCTKLSGCKDPKASQSELKPSAPKEADQRG